MTPTSGLPQVLALLEASRDELDQCARFDAKPGRNSLFHLAENLGQAVNYLREHGEEWLAREKALPELIAAASSMCEARNAAIIGARTRLRAALLPFIGGSTNG